MLMYDLILTAMSVIPNMRLVTYNPRTIEWVLKKESYAVFLVAPSLMANAASCMITDTGPSHRIIARATATIRPRSITSAWADTGLMTWCRELIQARLTPAATKSAIATSPNRL